MRKLGTTLLLGATVALLSALGIAAIEGVRALLAWNVPTTPLSYSLARTLKYHVDTRSLPSLGSQPQPTAPAPSPEGPPPITAAERGAGGGAEGLITAWPQVADYAEDLARDCFLVAGDVDQSVRDLSLSAWQQQECPYRGFYVFSPEGWKMALVEDLIYHVGYINLALQDVPHNVYDRPSLVSHEHFRRDALSERSRDFIDQYVLRWTLATTDHEGYRRTLPESNAEKVILVVGDSVPFGALVNDDETAASFLQANLEGVRVVNSGIPSSQADDNFYRLRRDLERFEGRVAGVVYFHTHNDFFSSLRPGTVFTPREVVEPIVGLLERHGIENAVFVAHESVVYNATEAVAQYNRQDWQVRRDRHVGVVEAIRAAGFPAIDTYELFRAADAESGTHLGSLQLLVDGTHLSAVGNRVVADRLLDLVKGWVANAGDGPAAARAQ